MELHELRAASVVVLVGVRGSGRASRDSGIRLLEASRYGRASIGPTMGYSSGGKTGAQIASAYPPGYHQTCVGPGLAKA